MPLAGLVNDQGAGKTFLCVSVHVFLEEIISVSRLCKADGLPQSIEDREVGEGGQIHFLCLSWSILLLLPLGIETLLFLVLGPLNSD